MKPTSVTSSKSNPEIPPQHFAIIQIITERRRQNKLVETCDLPWNCSNSDISSSRKVNVLVEELGEIAQIVDKLENPPAHKRWIDGRTDEARRRQIRHLRTEITQLAACCVAWLESLP